MYILIACRLKTNPWGPWIQLVWISTAVCLLLTRPATSRMLTTCHQLISVDPIS